MAWFGTREGKPSEWGRKDCKEADPHLRGAAQRWAIEDQRDDEEGPPERAR